MKVGAFQIGRYHAIIKKSYADGSADYETSFQTRQTSWKACIVSSYVSGKW